MARAVSIIRVAFRTTSSRAFRWSSPQETEPVAARPSRNTTSSTRLNFRRRPIRSFLPSPAPGELRVRPREPDEAERGRVGAGGGPPGPEPELGSGAHPSLELLDEGLVS